MINSVVLVGRTTKDIEMKYTGSGIAYAQFDIAVNRSVKDSEGKQLADFIKIIAWRAQAEICAKYVKKGMQVGVTGRIETGSYTASDGTKRYTTQIVANGVQFLDSKRAQEPEPVPPFMSGPDDYQNSQFHNNDSQINIDDDDLPF